MLPTRQGSFRLFRVAGIDVFLHWSWILAASLIISQRTREYSSLTWNVLEYLALFTIVLLHEFGHALACRQVGGQANQIVLWPLGGVAYVSPPPRPGATLWSLAAGPLVNVALLPVLVLLWFLAARGSWEAGSPNAYKLLESVMVMNIGLLIFNLLPVYPLDGGQILRCLLWFFMGPSRSLKAASGFGFVGVALLLALAVRKGSLWIGILSVFILMGCWRAWKQARLMVMAESLPRHAGMACPVCHRSPPAGPFWLCARCRTAFDPFDTQAACPSCGEQFPTTRCPDCGAGGPWSEWIRDADPVPPRM